MTRGITGDLLDAAITAGTEPKRCVNLLLGRGAALANERNCTIAEIGITPEQLAQLGKMISDGEVNATAAEKIFVKMIETHQDPRTIAESEDLLAVTDSDQIEAWVVEAISANPDAVRDASQGGKKEKRAFGFLMGQVMQRSHGAAVPSEVQRLLKQKLGS